MIKLEQPFYEKPAIELAQHLIGKIIVHGDTREQAIARMRTALAEMVVEVITAVAVVAQVQQMEDQAVVAVADIPDQSLWLQGIRQQFPWVVEEQLELGVSCQIPHKVEQVHW